MSMQEKVDLDLRLTILTERSPEDLTRGLRDALANLFVDDESGLLSDGEYLVELKVSTKGGDVPPEFPWNKKPIESMSKEELIVSLKTIGSTIEQELKQAVRRMMKGSGN